MNKVIFKKGTVKIEIEKLYLNEITNYLQTPDLLERHIKESFWHMDLKPKILSITEWHKNNLGSSSGSYQGNYRYKVWVFKDDDGLGYAAFVSNGYGVGFNIIDSPTNRVPIQRAINYWHDYLEKMGCEDAIGKTTYPDNINAR